MTSRSLSVSYFYFLVFLFFNFHTCFCHDQGEQRQLALVSNPTFADEGDASKKSDRSRESSVTFEQKPGDYQDDEYEWDEAEQQTLHLAEDVFFPTTEWQTVKQGQHIPRGLHVRLDLSSGAKEAKLMEGDDASKYRVWTNGERKGVVNTEHKYFTLEELKGALKDLKDKAPAAQKYEYEREEFFDDTNLDEGDVKGKFKSYKELKQDFHDINMNIKTDIELMKELLFEYKSNGISTERRLAIFEDLEYYVHQIDNAQNFVDLGGFGLLKEVFNDSSAKFRAVAGFVLGSACQSNPKVQVAAVEYGFLHQIIQSFNVENDFSVRKKYLYALSAILRQFPYAQRKFLELGGAELFNQVLREQSGQEKQKVKIITLLSDLILEKQHVEKEGERNSERKKQYQGFDLMETLLEKGWCSLVPNLLDLPDWDSQEKVLMAMNLMFSKCQREFRTASFNKLSRLKARYEQELSREESSDNDYLKELLGTVDHMLSTWYYREEL